MASSDSYCLKCKQQTKTQNPKVIEKEMTSKNGVKTNRRLLTGKCAKCDGMKSKFVSSSSSSSTSSTPIKKKTTKSKSKEVVGNGEGDGNQFLVEKNIISKHTYNTLKNVAEKNIVGHIKILDKYFKIIPISS